MPASPKNYTEQEARDKNKTEYDATASAYDQWSSTNLLMQKVCYYSTLAEMELEGIEGKTFMELGCGPCPIGQELVKKGAKKIYGLDISQEMITSCQANLEKLGIADKFELVCNDIFDETFELSEKVDVVVCSYVLSTFITSEDMLAKILERAKKQLKPDGYLIITDFYYVVQPKDDWWAGMHTA